MRISGPTMNIRILQVQTLSSRVPRIGGPYTPIVGSLCLRGFGDQNFWVLLEKEGVCVCVSFREHGGGKGSGLGFRVGMFPLILPVLNRDSTRGTSYDIPIKDC